MTTDAADPLADLSDALVDLLGAVRRVTGAASDVMADPDARERLTALVTTLLQAASPNEAGDGNLQSS